MTDAQLSPGSIENEPVPRIERIHRFDPRLRAVDWLSVAYLLITLPVLLFYPDRTEGAFLLAGLHVAGAVVIVVLRRSGFSRTGFGRAVLGFYPLALFGIFYSEVGVLCRVLHPETFFDPVIQGMDERLFGGQPSQDLYLRLASRPLGEFLHVGYFSYYFLAPVLAMVLWFRRPRRQFENAIAGIALVFYISFLFFIFYPVAGPYHMFSRLDPEAVGLVMPKVARWVVDRGSSVGAAFPSSHVAVSIVVWLMALRYHTGLAVLFSLLVPPLMVGAIYGGFHYATDVLAGAILGTLLGTVGHSFVERISPGRRGWPDTPRT